MKVILKVNHYFLNEELEFGKELEVPNDRISDSVDKLLEFAMESFTPQIRKYQDTREDYLDSEIVNFQIVIDGEEDLRHFDRVKEFNEIHKLHNKNERQTNGKDN